MTKYKATKLVRIPIAFLLIGILMKIMHWPYANAIAITALAAIPLTYLFQVWKNKHWGIAEFINLFFAFSFAIRGIVVLLHLPGKLTLNIITGVAFLFWAGVKGTHYFNKGVDNPQKMTWPTIMFNGLFLVGALCIILGAIYKIMHWPGAGYYLIIGMIAAFIWVLKEIFMTSEKE